MAGDDNAEQRLLEKIEKAEVFQKQMKDANAAIRKFKKQGEVFQIAALMSMGYTEIAAKKLLEPDFAGRIGYASYQLTNNNANIKRMRGRLEQVRRNKNAENVEIEGEHARFEDCPSDNRVRLFFPGKPEADVRKRLKSNGFRWAPSVGAWQAYRNYHAMEVAKEIAGVK